MARASYAQNSFQGGEWSLTSQGRFELPTYRTAMNVCLNGIPIEQGAWTRRPGTAIGAFTRGGAAGRVVKWDFQEDAPYTMEFTAGYLRFYAGTSLVVNTDTQAVSGISSANPAVVHTGTHGWASGQQFVFQDLSVVDPYLMNRVFVGTVTDSTHLSLADAVTGTTLDGSLLQAFGTGTIARVVELVTTYSSSALASLRVVQAEKKAVLLQGGTLPQVLEATTSPSGAMPATFTINPAQFVDGPYLDPIPGMLITPASLVGLVGLSFSFQTWSSSNVYNTGDYVTYSGNTYKSIVDINVNQQPDTITAAWSAVGSGDPINNGGLESTDIGRHVRIFSEPLAWASGTTYAAHDKVKYNNAYWTSLAGSNTNNQPGTDATQWSLNPANAIWSWGKITSLSGATTSLIDRTSGTNIGDFTADSGLAAAFNGTTSQTNGQGAGKSSAGPYSYIGKNYGGSPSTISYGICYGSTDGGFEDGGFATRIQINLRASNSAPANHADGVLLGSTGPLANSLGIAVQINSNDLTTQYQYVWFEYITLDAGANTHCAQAQFYNITATAGTGMTIQLLGPPLLYTTASTLWRLGSFSDTLGWPKCGTFHEGRLWLSGAIDNRLDASALVDINGLSTSSLFTFTPTLSDGTVSAACAIDYTLNGPDVNAIFWMQPDQQGIIVGTQAGEWLVQASALNNPLTPLSMQAHRVTRIGCANIEPRRTEHTNVFVQKHQHKIIEYFADIFSGKFTAPNLSEYAKHLSNRGLAEIAYQQELAPIIWARCNDGSLIGCTYKRDTLMTSQGPTFMGWHRHILGSGRTVESITVGPSPGNAKDAAGTLDTLAMVTSDGTYRQVEFLTSIFDETRLPSDAWFVDSGVIGVTTQGVTSGGNLGMLISGLWPLNGKTCSVVCGGYDCGDFAVANGQTFVPYTNVSTGIFTQTFATAAPQTIVGFTYNSDGQLVRPATPQESGARTGPALGKKRRTDHAAWLLNQTQGLVYGTTFALDAGSKSQMKTANFQTPGGALYAANALYSGVWWDSLTGGDDYDSMICWRVARPYPATICAIEGWVDSKDA